MKYMYRINICKRCIIIFVWKLFEILDKCRFDLVGLRWVWIFVFLNSFYVILRLLFYIGSKNFGGINWGWFSYSFIGGMN